MSSSLVRTVRSALPLVMVATLAACGDDDDNPMDVDQNQAPNAVATASPMEIPPGDDNQTVVTLDGSDSSDPDGDPLTFDWTVPMGTFVNGTSASSETPEVTFPGNAPYDVVLRVTDDSGASDQATVTVGLVGVAANQAPTADISASPTSVPAGDGNQTVVTLDGSGSSDPDGDPLTFDWTVQSGTFVNGTSSSSEIAEVTFPGNAPYDVTLEVSDGNGGSDTANTIIGVS